MDRKTCCPPEGPVTCENSVNRVLYMSRCWVNNSIYCRNSISIEENAYEIRKSLKKKTKKETKKERYELWLVLSGLLHVLKFAREHKNPLAQVCSPEEARKKQRKVKRDEASRNRSVYEWVTSVDSGEWQRGANGSSATYTSFACSFSSASVRSLSARSRARSCSFWVTRSEMFLRLSCIK